MMDLCKGCGTCSDCVPREKEEHRGSRMPVDPLFHAAAASGFEPLTDDARESFREKAGILRKVVGGKS